MTYISRHVWGARYGAGGTRVRPDLGGVAVHYNGSAVGTRPHRRCPGLVRAIDDFHGRPQDAGGRGWKGIAYNWVVCEHGSVFEGRGWGRRSAAQGTNDGNDRFLAVMFLVGEGDPLPAPMLGAGRTLVLELRERGAGTEVLPHSGFKGTPCPGVPLRDWIGAGMPAYPAGAAPAIPGTPGIALLRTGSTGARVGALQETLQTLGLLLPEHGVDCDFGPETDLALRAAQSRLDARADGVFGPETERAVASALGLTT